MDDETIYSLLFAEDLDILAKDEQDVHQSVLKVYIDKALSE